MWELYDELIASVPADLKAEEALSTGFWSALKLGRE